MKIVFIGLLAIAAFAAAFWFLAPREPLEDGIAFDPEAIGTDIDAYLYNRERAVPNLKRGAQKHVLWANPATKAKTPLAFVYIHGFSATLEEIRPVPDRVARTLGANLHYTRLAGHGRDGAAMAQATVPAWRRDVAEALEIGRRIGERVVVIATSTGGSLAAVAATDPELNRQVAGIVFVSPNFGLMAEGSHMLDMPFSRTLLPMILGNARGFAPHNSKHQEWWTERYPTQALAPLAAAVRAAGHADVAATGIPALFMFSDADRVVDAARTREVAARWGGPVTLWPVELGLGDDPMSHVIAGDILSPGLTDRAVTQIVEWVRARGL